MSQLPQQKIEAIVSDPRVREVMLTIFAESMAYIRDRQPAWCFVRFQGKFLRLFAGRLIVLTLERDHVWTTTDPSTHDAALSQLSSWCWDTIDTRPRNAQGEPYPRYKRPPSRNGYYTPSLDSGGDWQHIQESHFAYLDRVLAEGVAPDPRTVDHHESDVADYIAKASTRLSTFPADENSRPPYLRRTSSQESIDHERDQKTKGIQEISSEERHKRLVQSPPYLEKKNDRGIQFLADPEEVCRRLVPSRYWNDVMEALGVSIELVHQKGPERWGVRLAADSIMLKAGPHEVLQIHSREWERPFHIVVDKNRVPPEMRRMPGLWFSGDRDHRGNPGAQGYYLSNPESEACDLPFERVKDVYQPLLDAHVEVIVRATRKRRHASTSRTHSPELVVFVSQVLRKSLPQPAYCGLSTPPPPPLAAEELRDDERYSEGAARQIMVNAYERDRRARQRCIDHYGAHCSACGMSFEERYGPEATGIIHVHHIVPLSEIGERYEVDPIRDLRPVCPNCHIVIHATKHARTVEQVAKMVRGG